MNSAVTVVEETVPVIIDRESGEVRVVTNVEAAENHDLKKLNHKGIRNLVTAIIQQAVDDVKALTIAGVVKGGVITTGIMPHRICDSMTMPEAREALRFFDDRNIGVLLTMGDIDIEPRIIRQRLGFDW